jgi:hypothetical protein
VLRLTGITILGGVSVKRQARDFEVPSQNRQLEG